MGLSWCVLLWSYSELLGIGIFQSSPSDILVLPSKKGLWWNLAFAWEAWGASEWQYCSRDWGAVGCYEIVPQVGLDMYLGRVVEVQVWCAGEA